MIRKEAMKRLNETPRKNNESIVWTSGLNIKLKQKEINVDLPNQIWYSRGHRPCLLSLQKVQVPY